jgi:hypothetical protein
MVCWSWSLLRNSAARLMVTLQKPAPPMVRIVAQADAAVFEEAREDVDATEHVVPMALATSLWRESLPRSRFIQSMRSYTSGAISLRRAATRASGRGANACVVRNSKLRRNLRGRRRRIS